MSVRREVRAHVVALLRAAPALADVQVSATLPGEDQALTAAIWVDRISSRFETRGLGGLPPRQSETLTVDLAIDAYGEAPRQLDGSAAAVDRAEELLGVIEDVIGLDPTLGVGQPAVALVKFTTVTARARERGWLAQATCRIEVTNYPAIP